MGEGAREDVAEDLKVAVRVGWEARVGLDPVLVEDPQGPEVGEVGVEPVREAEGMVGVEPAMVAVTACGRPVRCDLDVSQCVRHDGRSSLEHGTDGCLVGAVGKDGLVRVI